MAFRSVPAGNGVNWLTGSVQLILNNPGPFVLMGLVMAVASIIPLLGSLALAILGPALYGGIAWAAREQEGGNGAQFAHIAQAFQTPGKLPPMLVLCLPGIVLGMLASILLVFLLMGAAVGAGVSHATESPAALIGSLGAGAIVLLIAMLAGGLVVFALSFFAIPDVMFARNDGFAAMKESLRASLANAGAILVWLIVVFAGVFLAMLILSLISSILAQLLVSIALAPIVGASMYLAWKDVYALPEESDASETQIVPVTSPDDGGFVA